MQLRSKLSVFAEITVNDREAEILEHLCSYSLAEYFAEKCSGKYSSVEIRDTLHDVKRQAQLIVMARNKALNAISDVEREK